MTLPSLTIAGLAVAGDDYGEHAWVTSLGIRAPEVVWLLAPDVAAKVMALQETEIVFSPPNRPKQTYKRVVVVGERATGDPTMRAIVLSDVRWYWPRIRVCRKYNVTTHSADRRLLLPSEDPQAVPAQLAPNIALQIYAPFSLKGGGSQGSRPWQPDEIAQDIATYVMSQTGSPANESAVHMSSARLKVSYVPQDIEADLPGDIAVGTALGLLGGVEVRVEPDGSITVLDSHMGAEREMLESKISYSIDELGLLRWIDMRHVAPVGIDVLYSRECEVRADNWERAPSSPIVGTQLIGTPDPGTNPIMENVIEVTDLSLNYVPDLVTGAFGTAVQGSFVPVDALAYALLIKADYPETPGPLTRAWWVDHPFGSLAENTFVAGFLDGSGPSELWAARIGAWRRDFRRTYRLNATFTNQCIPGSIVPMRVALLDPATGTRAPSPAFHDYCRRPTVRALKKDQKLGWNVNAIPPDVGQSPDNSKEYADDSFPDAPVGINELTVAPSKLRVWDSTTGLFHLDMIKDSNDQAAQLVPSLVTGIPTVDPSQVAISAANVVWESAQLVETHRLVVIFSAMPAGPNNEGSLHSYAISPFDAINRLGVSLAGNVVDPQGPRFQLRVGPKLARAWIAWDDDERETILSFFTDPGGDNADLAAARSTLTPVNDDQLRDYALSISAVLMACMLNHYEGEADVDVDFTLVPVGSAHTITHRMTADGTFLTHVSADAVKPHINPEFSLSQGTRAALFGNLGS